MRVNHNLRYCKIEGCDKQCHPTGVRKSDGQIKRNPHYCTQHHREYYAKKNGVKNYPTLLANNAGFEQAKDQVNSKHPSRKHRKDYCENIDGRLGYTCTYPIDLDAGMLEVDHIDGNRNNNDPDNFQTLCCNCHCYKSYINRDKVKRYATTKNELVDIGDMVMVA